MEVSISASLECALFHLSHASVGITLWADALCINQSDDGEKSEAAQQMKAVYQNAIHVVVWLGPSDKDSDLALEVIDQLGKEACDIGFWDPPHRSFQKALLNDRDSGPFTKLQKSLQERISVDYPFEAIGRLTRRPWWYRFWVLQEFILARDVSFICGSRSIARTHFAPACLILSIVLDKVIRRVPKQEFEGPKGTVIVANMINTRLGDMFGARTNYHRDPNFHETLIRLLHRANSVSGALNIRATDPRDKIFGILGLACDTEQLGIRPDYFKSCEEVYINAAQKLLQHGHTDILAFSQFPKHYKNLPTWVPDWTTAVQQPCGGCTTDAQFSASGETSVCNVPTLSSDTKRLIALHGARVDTISQVGAPWQPDDSGHNWAQSVTFISDIESFCTDSDRIALPIYKFPEQRKVAVWRIPCGDLDRLSVVCKRARSTGPDVLKGFRLLKEGFGTKQVR